VTDADVRHVTDTLGNTPAYMCDGLWDIRIRNGPMKELVPSLELGMNIMHFVLRPQARPIFPDFEAWADPMLGRLQHARLRADPAHRAGLDRLLEDLMQYEQVREFWNERLKVGFDPIGDTRRVRPPDPSSPDGLGEPIEVELYSTTPPSKSEDWRIMCVTRLDRPTQPGERADQDPNFWWRVGPKRADRHGTA
jgi:hypothetical protein